MARSLLSFSLAMGGFRGKNGSKVVAIGSLLVLVAPVLFDLFRSPRYRPFGYAAGDTFYYLNVSRSMIEHGSVSLDHVHATNGFHPLWQLLSAVAYALSAAIGPIGENALLVTILISLVCAAAGLWLMARAYDAALGRVPLLVLGLPIGAYALFASYYWRVGPSDANGGLEGPLPVYGTLYSYVNGMESSLLLLAFGSMMLTFVLREADSSFESGVKCGASCALVCLARLDHAMFVVTPLLLWALELAQSRARYRFLLGALGATIAPILVYCLINQAYVGVPLPISGMQKSRFPMPYLEQVGPAIEMLKYPLKAFDPLLVYRILPMVLCPLWALAYVAIVTRIQVGQSTIRWALRSFTTRMDVFLVKMAPGVVLLAGYDMLYVFGVGHWYFPISTLYVSLTLIALVHAAMSRLRPPPWLRGAVGAALAAAVLLLFVRFHYKPRYHEKFAEFYWSTAARVREKLGGKVPALVEFDDGIVAYSLNVPSMSGIGYLLDPEAMRAQRAQRLFDVAYHRGVRAVATFYYAEHGKLQDNEYQAHNWAQRLLGEDLSAYRATLLFGDATFSLVSLEAKGRQ